jgi:hypothetical protein
MNRSLAFAEIWRPWSGGRAKEEGQHRLLAFLTSRDQHIAAIAAQGRTNWQKASGCNWLALVEADIARWKQLIGGVRHRGRYRGRRFEPYARTRTPEYVRIVCTGMPVGTSAPERTIVPCNKVLLN